MGGGGRGGQLGRNARDGGKLFQCCFNPFTAMMSFENDP